MQVTIEGIVTVSGVIDQGEQRTVEATPFVRGLMRNRLVRQIGMPVEVPERMISPEDSDTFAALPDKLDQISAPTVEDTSPVVEVEAAPAEEPAKPKRTRRRTPDTAEE